MNLPAHDKNQIQLINDQVLLLQEREAADFAIVEALADFIPEIRCMNWSGASDEMKKQLDANAGFAYFVSLLDGLSENNL